MALKYLNKCYPDLLLGNILNLISHLTGHNKKWKLPGAGSATLKSVSSSFEPTSAIFNLSYKMIFFGKKGCLGLQNEERHRMKKRSSCTGT